MTAVPFTEQAVEAVLAWRRQHGMVVPSEAPADLPAAPAVDPKLRAALQEIGHLRQRCELLAGQEERERRRAEDAEAERDSARRTLENTRRQLDVANQMLDEVGRDPVPAEPPKAPPRHPVTWAILAERADGVA